MNDWSFKRWDQPILAIYDIYIYTWYQIIIYHITIIFHCFVRGFPQRQSPEAIPLVAWGTCGRRMAMYLSSEAIEKSTSPQALRNGPWDAMVNSHGNSPFIDKKNSHENLRWQRFPMIFPIKPPFLMFSSAISQPCLIAIAHLLQRRGPLYVDCVDACGKEGIEVAQQLP